MPVKATEAQCRRLGISPRHKSPKIKGDGHTGRDKAFDLLCASHGLPCPTHEYQFHPTRKWRIDYLFEDWLAVEKQGGLFVEGRHTQGAALLKEYEKLNELAIRGYHVLFVTPEQIASGEAFALIARALTERE